MTQTPISTTGYLPLRSKNIDSIKSLKPLAQSLLLAELSMISYLSEDLTRKLAKQLNFDEVIFYEQDGSQAYSFINETDHVIACRGTEPSEWNDVRADLGCTNCISRNSRSCT